MAVAQDASRAGKLIAAAAGLSLAMAVLGLAAPLFMLSVYDIALPARAPGTLVALGVATLAAHAALGVLDWARACLLARAGAERAASALPSGLAAREQVQLARFLESPVAGAAFDLAFAPVFLIVMWAFHPALGWLGLAGAAVLLLVGLGTGSARIAQARAELAAETGAWRQAEQALRRADPLSPLVAALGQQALRSESRLAATGLAAHAAAARRAATARALRAALASGALGLGAWLVIGGALEPAAMVTGSILAARALAPFAQLGAAGDQVAAAWHAWRTARGSPPRTAPLDRPAPALRADPPAEGGLVVERLAVAAPSGRGTVIAGASLALAPGDAVAVTGDAGAGKSALLHGLAGIWPLAGGTATLDGLGISGLRANNPGMVGVLLQTSPAPPPLPIAAVISAGRADAALEAVIAAARAASVEAALMRLPDGFATRFDLAALSCTQRERVWLAAALFGAPRLVLLDDPDRMCDDDAAWRLAEWLAGHLRRGGMAVLATRRPELLALCRTRLELADPHTRHVPTASGPASAAGTPAKVA